MSNLRKTLSFYLLVLLTASFVVSTSKNAFRYLEMQREIAKKEEKLQQLFDENEEARKKLISFGDKEKEELVRDKLSMVKEGETILILEDNLPEEKTQAAEPKEKLPNWQKWLALFIKNYG